MGGDICGPGGVLVRRYGKLVRHQGNEGLFAAVEMSVLAITRGVPLHLHAEGLRGTGKTTVLRAARAILPPIERVRGCPYNCRPDRPHCPQHRGLGRSELERIGTETVPMPFLEVSASAKVGTVIGSIDLGRVLDRENPAAALLPGTVARAHRGILFVDEINRLADVSPELADALLDVMGTKPGRLQIEETGLPRVEMEVTVAVWAASNPDEEPGPLSDIRRQLADRFDLAVAMVRPSRTEVVRAILDRDPFEQCVDTAAGWPEEACWRNRHGATLPSVDAACRDLLAEVYVRFNLESLRAVEAWQTAARLNALRAGRPAVEREDLLATVSPALGHRVELDTLGEIIAYLRQGEKPHTMRPAGVEARQLPPAAMAGPTPSAAAARAAELTAASARAAASPAEGGAAVRASSWWARLRGGAKAPGATPFPAEGSDALVPRDPMRCEDFAPPGRARPLFRLSEQDLVRTSGFEGGGGGLRV